MSQTQCSICLGDSFSDKSFLRPCLHQFCYLCILIWLKQQGKCAICRLAPESIVHSIIEEAEAMVEAGETNRASSPLTLRDFHLISLTQASVSNRQSFYETLISNAVAEEKLKQSSARLAERLAPALSVETLRQMRATPLEMRRQAYVKNLTPNVFWKQVCRHRSQL